MINWYNLISIIYDITYIEPMTLPNLPNEPQLNANDLYILLIIIDQRLVIVHC
jgi:hypothetical protein